MTTNQLVFLTTCYVVLVLNLPFIIKTGQDIIELENYNMFFLISIPLFLLSLSLILQSLLCFGRATKAVLIFTVLISSLIFYSTNTYGVVLDYGMVQNTLETDKAELYSYINVYAVLFFIIFGGIPSVIIYLLPVNYKSLTGELLSRFKLIIFSFLALISILMVFYSNYASIGRNNRHLVNYITPYKLFEASYKFMRNNYFYSPLDFEVLDNSPSIINNGKKKHVMVLVLGETARSKNFSLNGYEKPTNQYTQKLGVISFSNMSSCGTATAVSVPCMFSRFNKNNYEKRHAKAQQNVVDIINLAGSDVLWISNNNGSCKDVCTRVKYIKISTDRSNPFCDGEYCYDEALLNPLREKLNNLTGNNTLIVLHMIGSHGPTYFKRYPSDKRIFTPDCKRSDIQNCTNKELVNTYDNTIVYTDYVLSQVILELNNLAVKDDFKTSMLYVSDHGESLGENGVYLHGIPYAFAPVEQTNIPMIFWTDTMQSDLNLDCLKSIANKALTHDNLFDILLGLMSVRSTAYNPENDVFTPCELES